MSEHKSLPELLDILTQHVENKQSGTVYINSDCNHVIAFALDKGRISALFFGPKRGLKAVDLIRGITGGSYRFETAAPAPFSQELPATDIILAQLRSGSLAQESAGSAGAGAGMSSSQATQLQQGLKQLLTSYLGPIASMVLDDCCQGGAGADLSREKAQALVEKLAAEVGDSEEAARFRSEANNLLKQVLSA